jgi:hypothetical protein
VPCFRACPYRTFDERSCAKSDPSCVHISGPHRCDVFAS